MRCNAPLAWETVFPYLSEGGGSVRSISLVGAGGQCIPLDPLLVHIAFPCVNNFSDIFAPKTSVESLVEVASWTKLNLKVPIS